MLTGFSRKGSNVFCPSAADVFRHPEAFRGAGGRINTNSLFGRPLNSRCNARSARGEYLPVFYPVGPLFSCSGRLLLPIVLKCLRPAEQRSSAAVSLEYDAEHKLR